MDQFLSLVYFSLSTDLEKVLMNLKDPLLKRRVQNRGNSPLHGYSQPDVLRNRLWIYDIMR